MGEIDRRDYTRATALGPLKDFYEGIFTTLSYNPITSARGLAAAMHCMVLFHPCKVLCVGSGNAYEAAMLSFNGFKVTTVDYHHPHPKKIIWDRVVGRGQELPFKDDTFDLLLCCECIEHLLPEDNDKFMLELKRVASTFYITIDDAKEPSGAHINLHVPDWWEDKFNELGFNGIFYKPQSYLIDVRGMLGSFTFNSIPRNRGINFYGHKVFQEHIWKKRTEQGVERTH